MPREGRDVPLTDGDPGNLAEVSIAMIERTGLHSLELVAQNPSGTWRLFWGNAPDLAEGGVLVADTGSGDEVLWIRGVARPVDTEFTSSSTVLLTSLLPSARVADPDSQRVAVNLSERRVLYAIPILHVDEDHEQSE